MPYIYILECVDGSYYTGSTTDLERRLWEHQNNLGAKYTARRLPVKLVYCDFCDRIDAVFFREKQIQGWSRKKKEALIAGESNQLHRLAECQNETHCRELIVGLGVGNKRGESPAPVPFDPTPVPFGSAQGTGVGSPLAIIDAQGSGMVTPLAIIALTNGGKELAAQIAKQLQAAVIDPRPRGLAPTLAEVWTHYDGFVLIMASGIAVRSIAPLLHDKRSDPGVVVLDEAGRFAISLIAGHLGGANALARRVAALTGGQAVITTASDSLGLTAIDLWARHHGLLLVDGSLTAASATLVNHGEIKVFSELPGLLPCDFKAVPRLEEAELVISNRDLRPAANASKAMLCPQNLCLGIGCNRGASQEQIAQAAQETCRQHGLFFQAVEGVATIDLKNNEVGLLQFAAAHGLELHFFDAEALNSVPGVTFSAAAMQATGAQAVAEPAALLAAQTTTLLIRKTKWKDVTIALAERPTRLTAEYQ